MALTDMIKNKPAIAVLAAALIIAAIIIAGLLYFSFEKSAAHTERTGSDMINEDASATGEIDDTAIKNMSEKEREQVQKAAALAAVSGRPVSGKVAKRPEYVSVIEWAVFNKVVRDRSNGDDAQLANFVNKILFYKKKEAWESSGLVSGLETEQRRKLAAELREMLPSMIKIGGIAPKEAKELESALDKETGMANR